MTKKDYELIANQFDLQLHFLKREYPEQVKTLVGFAKHLATRLEIDNPRFDRNRFLQACGIETPKTKTFTGLGGAVWTVPDEATKEHGEWVCPNYNNASALPDADGNCSLCGAVMVEGYPEQLGND